MSAIADDTTLFKLVLMRPPSLRNMAATGAEANIAIDVRMNVLPIVYQVANSEPKAEASPLAMFLMPHPIDSTRSYSPVFPMALYSSYTSAESVPDAIDMERPRPASNNIICQY